MAITESSINPNHGASVPDTSASQEQIFQATWLQSRGVKVEDRVRLARLSHMRYQHPDLDALANFMLDFGMVIARRTETEIWFRGYGIDQYVYYATKGPKRFLGGAFAVDSKDEFEKAAKIPGAFPVQDISGAPGGGRMVTIADPDGFLINIIFGQEERREDASASPTEKLKFNYPNEKQRLRQFNRFNPGPAAVHKLGHFGYSTQRFEELLSFYTSHFNIVPTDLLYMERDGHRMCMTTFMHLDLGKEHTDHHSFFLGASETSSHVHHCSFEVYDYDTQHLGHQWLARKGYRSVWGVGRHILGSQIFDYWWDPAGNMVEHYADGDLVNEDTPIGVLPAGHESLAIWGPEVPLAFLQ
ncbi:metapyrocatechase 2 [Aspergillus udagawae]|uniref:Metapyrocatechase 2 n=1 Tax=Aspergillus udagawae TaxID=91492 RepID=A0A8H3P6F5_9EURO|nr:metapyrocatechase 2 [Aspergillus udagawae]